MDPRFEIKTTLLTAIFGVGSGFSLCFSTPIPMPAPTPDVLIHAF